MAKKITKQASNPDVPAVKATAAISPFAEVAAESAAENKPPRAPRVFKVGKPAPHIEAAVEPAPTKRARKAKAVGSSDPFAEMAGTSPVKKLRKTKTAAASE